MRYLYNIGGIRILCDLPFPVLIRKESEEFFYLDDGQTENDLRMVFRPLIRITQIPEGGYWAANNYYVKSEEGHRIYHYIEKGLPPYARVSHFKSQPQIIHCDYLEGQESCISDSHKLCKLLSIECLFLAYNGLLLHASFIRWDKAGILFSASPDTENVTQMNLWVKGEGGKIINDGRVGLRRFTKGWKAYGLPDTGSSYRYRNESAPVSAIIVLRQGERNYIRQLNPVAAMHYLYPKTIIHLWDRAFTEKAVDLLLTLFREIPVYLLECLSNEDAVKLAGETIIGLSAERSRDAGNGIG